MYSVDLSLPKEIETPYGLYEIARCEDGIIDLKKNPSETILKHRNSLFIENPSILDDIKNFTKVTYFVRFNDYANDLSTFAFYTPTFDMDGLKMWLSKPYAVDAVRLRKKDVYESLIQAIKFADKPELLQFTCFLEGRNIKEVPASRKILSIGQMKQYVLMTSLFGTPSREIVKSKQEQKLYPEKPVDVSDAGVVRRIRVPVELPKPTLTPTPIEQPKPEIKSQKPQPVCCRVKLLHEPHEAKIVHKVPGMKSLNVRVEPVLRKFGLFCGHEESELDMVDCLAPYRMKEKLVSMCEVRDYPTLDFNTRFSGSSQ
jgi:hypothetical protein